MGTTTFEHYRRQFTLMIVVAVLSACGGGSSGGGGSANPPQDPPDTSPDRFNFSGRENAMPGEMVVSDSVTITGIDAPAPISITGGEYAIEGGAYVATDGTVNSGQSIQLRVQAAADANGSVTATLTVGDISSHFIVITAGFEKRVEAEAQTLMGGASVVTDDMASGEQAVLVGGSGFGLSVAEALDAGALLVAYRSQTAENMAVAVNGEDRGQLHLAPTDGTYAMSALVTSVMAGDTVTLVNTADNANSADTYIDYAEFAATPYRFVSTVLDTGLDATDGLSVGPDGNIYVSGGLGSPTISRITPAGESSNFASGLSAANGSDFDSNGNLYVADYYANAVRKITPDGTMTTFASSLDGPASVWIDKNDNLFVGIFGVDFSGSGQTVLRISPDGTVSTYASGGGLMDVTGVVGDGEGRIFATNWSTGRVYEVTNGTVTHLASTGGTINQMCFSNGYIYAPSPGDAVIRRIDLEGNVETWAGFNPRRTIDGPLSEADFYRPNSCDFSNDKTVLYIMDTDTGNLRKVDAGEP